MLSLDSKYVVEGLYYKHINRFLKFFPRENLKIFLYDDLKSDAESFSYAIFSFLGVDPLFKPTLLHKVYFGKKPRPKHQRLFNLMVSTTKFIEQRSRYACKKIEYLRKHNREYIDLFHRFNKGSAFPILSQEKKRSLAKYYWDDISALSDFLGRDLSAFWLSPFLD